MFRISFVRPLNRLAMTLKSELLGVDLGCSKLLMALVESWKLMEMMEIDAIKRAHHRIFQSKSGRSFLNLSRLFCSSKKIEAICLNALEAWHSASLHLLHTLFQRFSARHLQ